MKTLLIILLFFLHNVLGQNVVQNEVRYIFIEAPCKTGFNANNGFNQNVLLTPVFKEEFENAFEVVNAEPELIKEFEVALEKSYPNSRNDVKDILVYMLTSEKEAKELYKRKIKQFEVLKTGVIKLKLR
jgi:hypothetical protein